MRLPHIYITQDPSGNVTLEVEDTELYDFVEDYLVEECNIEPTGVAEIHRDSLCVYRMAFPASITYKKLESALQDIDPVEIERIFKLNNT